MLIAFYLITIPTQIGAYLFLSQRRLNSCLNGVNKPLNTGFQLIDKKLPIYPYIDTPVNLFWGHKKVSQPKDYNIFIYLNQLEKSGNGITSRYKDGLAYVIDSKLKESAPKFQFKPPYSNNYDEIDDLQNVDYYHGFKELFWDKNANYSPQIKIDLADYDALCNGLGKWPSFKNLIDSELDISTTLFPKFKPVKGLTSIPPVSPYRKEVKTIGEAIVEQKKWLERSKLALDDWNLSWEEMAGLPDTVRNEYYAERFELIKNNPSSVFELALKMRRATASNDDLIDYHPMEFKYMEDSYTYIKPSSPVANQLYKWQDPLESLWRIRVEEMIKDVVSYDWPPTDLRVHSGLVVHDITWIPGTIKIFVKRASGEDFTAPETLGDVSKEELSLLYSKIDSMLREIDMEEELGIYENHKIALYNALSDEFPESRRDWNEKIGLPVIVNLKSISPSHIKGELAGSNSVFGLNLSIEGNVVTIPTHFIESVCCDNGDIKPI